MAPEQARGRPTTPATDVYSVGVVLYEMLAGRPPFMENSVVELALRHLQNPPPALPAGIPGALVAIVKCALAKDPARRYASGTTMANALGRARVSLAAPQRPPRIGRRALRPPAPRSPAARPPVARPPVARPPVARPPVARPSAAYPSAAHAPANARPPIRRGPRHMPVAASVTAVTRAGSNSHHGSVATVTPPEPQLSDHTTVPERLSWPHEDPGATRFRPPYSPRRTVNPAARRRRAAALTGVLLLLLAMVAAAILIGSVGHVRVPSLLGLRRASIATRTRRLHLHAAFDNRFSPTAPEGTAISQTPAAGTRVPDGATVKVVLSAGPPPVELPGLRGRSFAVAEGELRRLGLRASITQVASPGVAAGTVTHQSPAAGAELRPGFRVSLLVAQTPRWRSLTSLAGVGQGRSVPFRILGTRWRIVYSMGYQGTCTFIFFCSGPSARVANLNSGSAAAAFDLNDGSDQTQVINSGPGRYQITVSPGDDTARWSIQVQDYY
jgi:serine/threonine-protein kinase